MDGRLLELMNVSEETIGFFIDVMEKLKLSIKDYPISIKDSEITIKNIDCMRISFIKSRVLLDMVFYKEDYIVRLEFKTSEVETPIYSHLYYYLTSIDQFIEDIRSLCFDAEVFLAMDSMLNKVPNVSRDRIKEISLVLEDRIEKIKKEINYDLIYPKLQKLKSYEEYVKIYKEF